LDFYSEVDRDVCLGGHLCPACAGLRFHRDLHWEISRRDGAIHLSDRLKTFRDWYDPFGVLRLDAAPSRSEILAKATPPKGFRNILVSSCFRTHMDFLQKVHVWVGGIRAVLEKSQPLGVAAPLCGALNQVIRGREWEK